jgi:hypothetical protein
MDIMVCEPHDTRRHTTPLARPVPLWRGLISLIAVIGPAGFGVPVFGQALEQRGYEPVDQLIEDIDPLQVSLRQQVSGLDETGERVSVFRPTEQRGGRLYYVQRGVVAEYDRSQYGITGRGNLLQMIPPNTVFHLSLPDSTKASATAARQAPVNPYQVNGLVDGRPLPRAATAEARADGRPTVGDMHRRLDDWQVFARVSRDQRQQLIASLGRSP